MTDSLVNPEQPEQCKEEESLLPGFDRRFSLPCKPITLEGAAAKDDAQFEMSFMEEVLRRDPCNEDALSLLGHAYTRGGDYERGLDIDRRLIRLRPEDPAVYYNLACSYALLMRVEDAFLALEKAVSLGYRDLDFVLKDPDLANLRSEPQFTKFVGRVFKGAAADS